MTRTESRYVPDNGPHRYLHPLCTLCIEFTRRCNLRCRHCGSSSAEAMTGELGLDDWHRVIQDAADLGCRDVTILGGEPLARKGIEHLAACIRAAGMRVALVTNGTMIDAQRALLLSQCGFDRIAVSLDAPTADEQDLIRGAGSFERTVSGIEHLRRAGITPVVISTFWAANASSIPRLAHLVTDLHLTTWQIQLATAHGRMTRDQMLSPAEMVAMQQQLIVVATHLAGILHVVVGHDIGYGDPAIDRLREVPGPFRGCIGGLSSAGITADGTIKPCLSLPDDRAEGSVRRESLSGVWRDPTRFADQRSWHRGRLQGACATCPQGDTCRGGCLDLRLSLGSATEQLGCVRRTNRPEPPAVRSPADHAQLEAAAVGVFDRTI